MGRITSRARLARKVTEALEERLAQVIELEQEEE